MKNSLDRAWLLMNTEMMRKMKRGRRDKRDNLLGVHRVLRCTDIENNLKRGLLAKMEA